jgi:hypothetical protein
MQHIDFSPEKSPPKFFAEEFCRQTTRSPGFATAPRPMA